MRRGLGAAVSRTGCYASRLSCQCNSLRRWIDGGPRATRGRAVSRHSTQLRSEYWLQFRQPNLQPRSHFDDQRWRQRRCGKTLCLRHRIGGLPDPKRRAHRGDVIAFGIKRQHRHLRGCSRIHRHVYQVPASSFKFYAAPGATSGGISLGASGNYNAASYTSYTLPPPLITSPQPFGTAAVGVFGADGQAFAVSGGTNHCCRRPFRSSGLAKHHGGLCGLGEWSESRRAEFAARDEHSRRSRHRRAAVHPDRSAVGDELQSLRNGRPYAGASRAIPTPKHRQCRPRRNAISEFQCAGHPEVRAVQFHFERRICHARRQWHRGGDAAARPL